MRLIVGLGNPGKAYARNRHNVGFWVVDELAENLRAGWSDTARFAAAIAKPHNSVVLAKPLTYMNRSGQAVAALSRFYRISPPAIVVVSDDIDLPFGRVRVRDGGGHGGHNGLRDIIAAVGQNFVRIRVGVGRSQGETTPVVGHVLGDFSQQETPEVRTRVELIASALQTSWADKASADEHERFASLRQSIATALSKV